MLRYLRSVKLYSNKYAKQNLLTFANVVNFLDVTFDLSTGKYKPYRKPNDDPLYIHKHSNHPPSILRQLPASINKRISTLSSDKQVFDDAVQTYQNALGHSNFSHKLEYMPHVTQQPRRNRQRNIIWFNPPFSKNVKTNIARSFLKLVDTHFPIGNKLGIRQNVDWTGLTKGGLDSIDKRWTGLD